MRIVDTHAHLDDGRLAQDLDHVLTRAKAAFVEAVLCVGTSLESSVRCVELARVYPAVVRAAVGIHPNHWGDSGSDDWAELTELALAPEVVAIGETGLDWHHTFTDHRTQEEAFRHHIGLSRSLDKPLILHARKADDAVLAVLREEGAGRGVRHFFDRSADVAAAYLDLGFHISVGAAVTRPGYKMLKAAVRQIPRDRLMLETDCPYQPPASKAGARNEPAFIVEALQAVAVIRDESADEVAAFTTANAVELFGLRPRRFV
jgi:TatD DNase family protein